MGTRFFFGKKAATGTLSGGVVESVTLTDSAGSAGSVLGAALAEVLSLSIANIAGTGKRAYLSWAELQVPPGLAPVVADVAESLSAIDQSVTQGGATIAAVCGEVLTAIATQAATGGTIAVIAAESLSLTDTKDGNTAVRVYLFWTDLQLPNPSINDAVNEAVALVESSAGVRLRVVSRAETVALVDLAAAQLEAAGSLDEVVAAQDLSNSIGGAYLVSGQEFLDVNDYLLGEGGVTPSDVEEPVDALDDGDAVISWALDSLDESLSFTDTSDGIVTAPVADTVLLDDSSSAVIITSGSVAERTAPADVLSAVLTMWGSVLEGVDAQVDQAVTLSVPPVFETHPVSVSRTSLVGGRLGGTTPVGPDGKLD